ncbi:hypothetical protein L1887_49100 [Cichorium endivia]|nr:hypothetical protein L1887_49100 [Cichorium endivia]
MAFEHARALTAALQSQLNHIWQTRGDNRNIRCDDSGAPSTAMGKSETVRTRLDPPGLKRAAWLQQRDILDKGLPQQRSSSPTSLTHLLYVFSKMVRRGTRPSSGQLAESSRHADAGRDRQTESGQLEDLLGNAQTILQAFADNDHRVSAARAPVTQKQDEVGEQLLRQVLQTLLKPDTVQLAELDPSKTPDDYLSAGTKLNLSRPFWLMIAKACTTRFSNREGKGDTHVRRTTATYRLSSCFYVYEFLSNKKVDAAVKTACYRLTNSHEEPEAREKVWATWDDIALMIKDHIFGQKSPQFSHPRQRLQLALLLVLMATTTARPGDILISEGYGDRPFCVVWKDVQFLLLKSAEVNAKTTKKGLRLLCRLKLRFMKGCKNNSDFREVMLSYDPSAPAILDPVYMLAALALEDNVVDEQALQCYERIDLDFLEPGEMLPLTIKESMRELPVFRGFVFEDGVYQVDPLIGWKERAAENSMRPCVALSPFKSFPFYACRRCSSMSLNRPEITDNDRRRAMGHQRNSDIYFRHYFSEQSAVDIQGLTTHGAQDESLPLLKTPERTPEIALTKTEESQALEQNEEYAKVFEEKEKLKDEVLRRYKTWGVARGSELYQQFCSAAAKVSYKRTRILNEASRRKGLEHRKNQVQRRADSALLMDDLVEEMDEDPDRAGLERSDSTEDVEIAQDLRALRLKVSLKSLSDTIDAKMEGKKDFSSEDRALLLKTDNDRPEIYQGRIVLLQQSATAVAEWTQKCPICQTDHSRQGQSKRWAHIMTCARRWVADHLPIAVTKPLESANEKIRCPFFVCRSRKTLPEKVNTEEDAKQVLVHLATHVVRDTTRTLSCPIRREDGTLCPFQVLKAGGEAVYIFEACDAQLSQFDIHLAKVHGVVADNMANMVAYCNRHQEWLVGYEDIESHFDEDLKDGERIEDHHCPFCFHDEKLRSSHRLRWHAECASLGRHVVGQHIITSDATTRDCPLCDVKSQAKDFPDHLIEQHGLNLAGLDAKGKPAKTEGDLSKLKNNQTKEMLDAYVAFIDKRSPTLKQVIPKARGSGKEELSKAQMQELLKHKRQKQREATERWKKRKADEENNGEGPSRRSAPMNRSYVPNPSYNEIAKLVRELLEAPALGVEERSQNETTRRKSMRKEPWPMCKALADWQSFVKPAKLCQRFDKALCQIGEVTGIARKEVRECGDVGMRECGCGAFCPAPGAEEQNGGKGKMDILFSRGCKLDRRHLLGGLSLTHGRSRFEGAIASAGAGAIRSNKASFASLSGFDSTCMVIGKILVVRKLAALEMKGGIVALSECKHVEQSENWLGEKVKNSIEYHLRIRGHDIGAVCYGPCNLRTQDDAER